MTALQCQFIQALHIGTANDLRGVNTALLGARNFENLAPGSGAIGRGHGVLAADALQVTAQLTPNNTVQVAPGIAVVRGTQNNSQGSYLCPLNAAETLTVSPKDSASTRIDLVVAEVRDAAFAGANNDWVVRIVEGTPGAGTPAVPESALALASITVAPGTDATVITSTVITDLRPQARVTGGITPVANRTQFLTPQNYEMIWEISTRTLLIRVGSSWVTLGQNLDSNWTTYTPSFGGVTLGNGSRYGRYQRFGRTVIGICGFDLGTTGNVTAAITATVPVACHNPGSDFRYMGAGRAFIGSVFYSCTVELNPSFNSTLLFNFATAGLPQWDGTNPANWGNPGAGNGQLRIFFAYEAA